ncbi:MAG: endonuclease NucS [Candidatus Diapherotrites archaeon]|nr:endonuclease NucS [Candidatus Diapherotrites archaeon]
MELEEAQKKISDSLRNKHLCTIVGECYVEYKGRASSKLPRGKRLVLIKSDDSVSIHENRLIRPTNYMMNAKISCEADAEKNILVLGATKLKPKERLNAFFYSIEDVQNYDLPQSNDLRLSGSEKELNDALMDDLSFLEPGLKPVNQQEVFRKGICDIIAEDAEGRLVVIELKRREADYGAVTQLKRYMEQVKKIKGKETRGILLAPTIRKNALELLHNYKLEYFHYDFEIDSEREKSKIKGIGKSQRKIHEYNC